MAQKASSTEGGEKQSCPKAFPLISRDKGTVPAEALASFSDTQGYLTREGHKGGGTVASLHRGGKTIPVPRCPAHASGLHQAAILAYKLCFSCNMYHTPADNSLSHLPHHFCPLAISTQGVKCSPVAT